MTPLTPPHPRYPNRLNFERLEDRIPASTTLDVLLAGLWLPPRPVMDQPASRSEVREQSVMQTRYPGRSEDLPARWLPGSVAMEEPSRPARLSWHEPAPLSVNNADIAFDLPFHGVTVSAGSSAPDPAKAQRVAVRVAVVGDTGSASRLLFQPPSSLLPAAGVTASPDRGFTLAPASDDSNGVTVAASNEPLAPPYSAAAVTWEVLCVDPAYAHQGQSADVLYDEDLLVQPN